MKEKWEDNFQKVFSDYERKVPDGLLDDIKREIEKRKLIPNVKKSSATLIPLWVQQVAAAVAVVLIVMGGFLWGRKQAAETEFAALTPTASMATSTLPQKGNSNFMTNAWKSVKSMVNGVHVNGGTFSTNLFAAASNPFLSERGNNGATITNVGLPSTESIENIADLHRVTLGTMPQQDNYKLKQSDTQIQNNRVDKANRFERSAQLAAVCAGNLQSNELCYTNVPLYSMRNNDFEMADNMNYYQSMNLGLSVRYNVTNRWSLLTGLTYAKMRSATTMNDRNIGFHEQDLRTVVNAKEIQPQLFGKDEYNFTKQVGIYSQHGIGNYINGGNVDIFYKSNPFNVNFKLGQRLNGNK